MKLLHEYEDGNYIWVFPEPEFNLDQLQQCVNIFEKLKKHPCHRHENVSLVDDDYKVEANIAVVLHDKHGIVQITYTPLYDKVLTRDKDGYFTSNRRELLRQAIEAILRRHERRLMNI